MRKLKVAGSLLMLVLMFSVLPESRGQTTSYADVQFELQAYDMAIDSYLQVLENEPDNQTAMEKLAISFDRTNDLINAARWYEKLLVRFPDQPDRTRIAYGKVLKSLGLYDQAKKMFLTCDEAAQKDMAGLLANTCDFAKSALSGAAEYEVYLYHSSSQWADFAPGLVNDQLVFSSFRKDDEDPCLYSSLIHEPLNGLFANGAERRASQQQVKTLGSAFFTYQGISSVNSYGGGGKVLFTRNNFRNGNRQILGDEKNMSVFLARMDEQGMITQEEALPFNSVEYSVAFACFGMDENTIFFSSNMHGDHTDFDLYYAQFDGHDWSRPVNLGDQVNTSGNEVTPFYAQGKLYFASDTHEGLGGYDNFVVAQGYDGWEVPENLGKGVNTMADDLYLIWNPEENSFYYSSNRLGGKGNYDIYMSIPNAPVMFDDPLLANKTEQADIPAAVSLNALQERHGVDVPVSSARVVSYQDNEMAPDDLSLDGAILVSYGEVIRTPANVFFIQLASLSNAGNNFQTYQKVVEFGNVYRVKKASSYKIRLGYFHDQNEAKSILSQVRSKGFTDAFIVEDILDIKELELLVSSFSFYQNEKYEKPEIESEYKVRLAAYTNPLYFDTEKVKDIGVIEQWSKGKWTIFILSGYESLNEAEQARIKAVNRGFTGAEIVRDEDGFLSRIKLN